MIEFTNELWSVFISVIALAGTLGSLLMVRTAGDESSQTALFGGAHDRIKASIIK